MTVLWASRWPSFPVGPDPAYHLFVAQQMRQAKGVLANEAWAYAPVGRPHLYPPALHLVLCAIMAVGLSPITAIRLVTAVVIPLLLASVYFAVRRLTSAEQAGVCLFVAVMPFSWMLHVGGTLASGMALIELLWLLVAVHESKSVSVSLLLALLFYTHLGLAWVGIATLACGWLIGGVSQPRSFARAVAVGLLLAAPWLWHLGLHLHVLRVMSRQENQTLDLLPGLVPLFVLGVAQACGIRGASGQGERAPLGEGVRVKGKGSTSVVDADKTDPSSLHPPAFTQAGVVQQRAGRLLLSLWVGFGLMIARFRYRWISGEGILPLVLLAGLGLAWLIDTVARRISWSREPLVICAGAVLALSPSLALDNGRLQWHWPDTAPFHLAGWPGVVTKPNDLMLYTRHTERVVKTVQATSLPGEILWSNAPYSGGLVAALAGRALSCAMLFEVPPTTGYDPIAAAHLILWFKIEPLPGALPLELIRRRYQLRLVDDDEIAWIFRREPPGPLAGPPRAVIPFWMAVVLLCGASGLIVLELATRRRL
ncbi:MAG: hypothetical protein HYZ92_02920 [Candidatus Omnitrophica bacterium]|nr:hypothetical protein [Candidatus Omnitrophota bacterium]